MRFFSLWAALLVAVLAALLPAQVRCDQPIPAFESYVTDLTSTLTSADRAALEQTLGAFERSTGSQIAVLIVPTTEPETIEQYSIRVVDRWKLGRKGVDDGVLMLIAKEDRAVRLEVGRGLEGALTDLVSKRIVDDIIVPNFRAGQFGTGVRAGVDAVLRVISGEELPKPLRRGRSDRITGISQLAPFLFFVALLFGGILTAIFGRFAGASLMGVIVFVIGTFFLSFLLAVFLGFMAFLFSLGGFGVSRARGYRSGWYGGGYGGGFRGGFGGGFGGGGGGFSGGGASGRW